MIKYSDAWPWPEEQAFWHFGIFAKKSNKKSNPIFPILSDFSDFSRLLDFPIPQLYTIWHNLRPQEH